MAQKKIDIYSRFQPTSVDTGAANKFKALAGISENIQGMAIEYGRQQQTKAGALEGQKAGEQAAKSGEQLETKGDFRYYDQAYNQAALTAYKTSVARDAKLKMQELLQEHQNDPEKFDASMQGYLKGLRQQSDPNVMAELNPLIDEFEYQTKSKYSALQYKRGREEVGANLYEQQQNLLDDISNAARAGDSDQLEISKAAIDDVIKSRVDAGYITREEGRQAREKLRESMFVDSELGKGYKVLDQDVEPAKKVELLEKQIESLKAGPSKDLSASQNQSLVDTIQSFKNSVIAQETKRRSQQSDALKARAEILKKRIALTKKAAGDGIELDQKEISNIILQSEEINEQAGKQLIDLADISYELQKSEKVSIFAKQPVLVQESLMSRLEAEQSKGLTPERADEYASVKRAHEKIKRQAQEDPLMLYAQQGYTEIEPLQYTDDNGNINLNSFADSLAKRQEIAAMAGQHYNVDASPITKQEAQSIASIMQELDYEQQSEFISKTVEGLGDDSVAVFEQISKNGGTVLAWAGGVKSSGGDPLHILRGQQLRKENKLLTPTGKDFERYAMLETEGAYSNPAARAAAINAAKSAYASLAYNAGEVEQVLDEDLADRALQIATGGLVEYGGSMISSGKKIPAPIYGMTQGQFNDFIEDFRPHYFDMAGTDTLAPGITKEKLAELISEAEVDLVDRGHGRYLIQKGSDFIMNEDGKPYQLNLRAIIE